MTLHADSALELVSRYSGATVPDFHRVPCHLAATNTISLTKDGSFKERYGITGSTERRQEKIEFHPGVMSVQQCVGGARRSQQQHIAVLADEPAGGQVKNLAAFNGGVEAFIVILGIAGANTVKRRRPRLPKPARRWTIR